MKIPSIHIPDVLGHVFAGGKERFWYLSQFKSMFAVSNIAILDYVYFNAPKAFSNVEADTAVNCKPFSNGCLRDKTTGKIVFGYRSGNGYLVFAVPGYIKLSRDETCSGESVRTSTGCWKLDPNGDYDFAYDLDKIAPGFKPVPYTTAWPLIAGLLTTVALSELVFFALSSNQRK